MNNKPSAKEKYDKVIAEARQQKEKRERDYRERALKLYPWICGRCSREFNRKNLSELTVHHRDHNHDNNPEDGSNWELLCVYCHDNEHSRYQEGNVGSEQSSTGHATHKPFANLKEKLQKQ